MENKDKKKKIGIIVAIILVLIIITGGVFAFLYFNTDTLKTQKELFFSYFIQNEKMLGNINETKNMIEIENLFKDETYTTNGEMTFNYESSEQDKMISDLKITVEGKTDNIEKQAYKKFRLMNNEEELFNVEYLNTNDLYAITSNQVVNKYLAVQNNNLKSFAKKLGEQDVSMIPDKIQMINTEIISKLSEEQIKSILNKYGNLIIEQTSDENYTKNKETTANINNQNYNDIEVYTLTLNKKETANLAKVLLENLKQDDETLNIFLELYKTNKTLDDLNDLKDYIQKMINQINTEDLSEELGLKINVYVKDEQLIATQIETPIKVSIEELTYEGLIDITIINSESETKVVFNIINNDNKDDNATINLIINKNDGIIIEFNNSQMNIGFTYKNQMKDEQTYTKKIELYIEQEDKVQINYDEENVITPNLKIDKLDANTNCVILNDYPQDELQTLMVQLQERLNQIFNRINEKITQEND